MRNKKKKIVSSIVISALLFAPNITFAVSLDELEKEKNNLEENVDNSKEKIKEYEKEIEVVEQNITSLEKKLFELQEKIKNTENAIQQKENEIAKKQEEINDLIKLIDEKTNDLEVKKEKLKQHIRFMYTGGKVSFLEALFRSDNLMQFINRYDTYQSISEEGEKLYYEILDEINFIEEQKNTLENVKKALEDDKAELLSIKQQQENQKAEHNRILHELESKHQHLHKQVEKEEEAMNAIMNDLKEMEKKIAAEKERIRKENEAKKKANTQTATGLGKGTLASPMKPGTYYISSHFGPRVHPIYGHQTMHNGTDFAAAQGTPIYAMEDGFVLYAGPARGYGNWVVIQHDNGLYTGYGHMYSNQIYVSPGQRVTRGQHIAGVGSAGDSTGNHLHFFVSTTGPSQGFTYVNPLHYIQR